MGCSELHAVQWLYISSSSLPSHKQIKVEVNAPSWLCNLRFRVCTWRRNTFQHCFDIHVNIARLAMLCAGVAAWILRYFRKKDWDKMLLLWKTSLRRFMDDCSQLCSPLYVKLIAKLETILRYYTKNFYSVKHMCYWEIWRSWESSTWRWYLCGSQCYTYVG